MARSGTELIRSEPADGTAGEPSGWGEDALAGFPRERDARRRPQPSRGLVLAGLAVAALLVVVFGSRNWWGNHQEAPARAEATLRIESTPAGASVESGGRSLGVTPLSLTLPPGAHTVVLQREGVSRQLTFQLAAGTQVVHHVELPLPAPQRGSLRVESMPPGARVLLDGALQGRTPLALADVEPGEHQLTLVGAEGSRSQRVSVAAGGVATVVVPLPGADGPAVGWLALSSPIELQLFEGQELVGSSRMGRVMLPAGDHELRLGNASVGFETTRAIRVRAGQVEALEVTVPDGALSVNAIPWAEVFLDGSRIGETPIDNYRASLGAHEVVLRHPRYLEHRRTVIVSLKEPLRLGIDMRQ